MKTRVAQKVPSGSIILRDFVISKPEIEFYQLLANDETVETAAEMILMSKRTCEDRMYRLQNHLGFRTRVALIVYFNKK